MKDIKGMLGDAPPEGEGAAVYEEPESGGHPVLAILIGSFLLVLIVAAMKIGPVHEEGNPAYAMGYLTGRIVMAAGIAWGIAYAITLRHASRGWNIAAVAIFATLAALVTLAQYGRDDLQLEKETKETARALLGAMDKGKLDSGENPLGKAPMGRMLAAAFAGASADGRAFEREAEAAGLIQVTSFKGLTRRSKVLDNCAGLDALAERARYYASRWPDHVAAASRVGNEAVQRGEMPRAALDGFEKGVDASEAKFRRQWELNGLIVAEASGACRVLARRNWEKPGDRILFRSTADMNAFNAHARRSQALSAEMVRSREASLAEVRRGLEEIAR